MLFLFDENRLTTSLNKAVEILGFEPKFLNITIDEFTKPKYSIKYNKHELASYIQNLPNSIIFQNEEYEQDNSKIFSFFRVGISNDTAFPIKHYSFEWSNSNLDFLLQSEQFKQLLLSENLIYSYCYDQKDTMLQSNNSRINPDFEKPMAVDESYRDFTINDVDISKNWGRILSVHGLEFMAAPLMWFGKEFYKIVPKEKLLELGTRLSKDVIEIKLFDLYANTSEQKNREKQRFFWEKMNLERVVSEYVKNNPLDMATWIMSRVAKKKKSKQVK